MSLLLSTMHTEEINGGNHRGKSQSSALVVPQLKVKLHSPTFSPWNLHGLDLHFTVNQVRIRNNNTDYSIPVDVRYNFSTKYDVYSLVRIIHLDIYWDLSNGSKDFSSEFEVIFSAHDEFNTKCKDDFVRLDKMIPSNSTSFTVPPSNNSRIPRRLRQNCTYEFNISNTDAGYLYENLQTLIIPIPEPIEDNCKLRKQLPPPINLRILGKTGLQWDYNYPEHENVSAFVVFFFRGEGISKRHETIEKLENTSYKIPNILEEVNRRAKIEVHAYDEKLCRSPKAQLFVACENKNCICSAQLAEATRIVSRRENNSFTKVEWLYQSKSVINISGIEVLINNTNERIRLKKYNDKSFSGSFPCNETNDSDYLLLFRVVDNNSCYGAVKEFRYNCLTRSIEDTSLSVSMMAILVFGVTVGVLVVFFLPLRRLGCLRRHGPLGDLLSPIPTSGVRKEFVNILYGQHEFETGPTDKYEISYCRLTFGKEIGKGEFGRVYIATADALIGRKGKITVAVKRLREDASDYEKEDFLDEIKMLKQIGNHRHIVTMLACCTLQQPYCMVMEFVPFGDLLRYLRQLRTQYEMKWMGLTKTETFNSKLIPRDDSSSSPTSTDYLIPKARSYDDNIHYSTPSELILNPPEKKSPSQDTIETIQLFNTSKEPLHPPNNIQNFNPYTVQRNHALNAHEEKSTIECNLDSEELQCFAQQIADGMNHLSRKNITHRDLAARNILIDERKTLKISDFGLSRNGVYVTRKGGRLPLRWLSIEAIRDKLYSEKSDVWAYGIVLWEICTLGGFPYGTVSNEELLPFLMEGKRLSQPSNCDNELYEIMKACWLYHPKDRPSFDELCSNLKNLHKEARTYVNFDKLNDTPLPPFEEEATWWHYQRNPAGAKETIL